MQYINKMKFRAPVLIACLILAATISGCKQGPGYQAVDLEGEVTVAGNPLETGSIQFIPQESGQGPIVGANIVAGHYEVKNVPQGKVRVVFTSNRKGKRLPSVGTMEVWSNENMIPEKFRQGILIQVNANETIKDFEL